MELLLRPNMPSAKGNQPPRDGDRGTRQVRVFEDVGDMISWIIRIEGGTTANLLDPMIRVQVVARYAKHADRIEKIKAAEAELRRVEEEARKLDEGGGSSGARKRRHG